MSDTELKQAWQAFQESLVAAAAAQERINQAARAGDPDLRAMIVNAADASPRKAQRLPQTIRAADEQLQAREAQEIRRLS